MTWYRGLQGSHNNFYRVNYTFPGAEQTIVAGGAATGVLPNRCRDVAFAVWVAHDKLFIFRRRKNPLFVDRLRSIDIYQKWRSLVSTIMLFLYVLSNSSVVFCGMALVHRWFLFFRLCWQKCHRTSVPFPRMIFHRKSIEWNPCHASLLCTPLCWFLVQSESSVRTAVHGEYVQYSHLTSFCNSTTTSLLSILGSYCSSCREIGVGQNPQFL